MRGSPQVIKLNDKLQSTLAEGYVDTCGQTHPPLQGSIPLSCVTPSWRFEVCNVVKTHVPLGSAVRYPSPPAFPRCAKFKGKVMEDVSVDMVPPPAGPNPSSGSIPTPSLLYKAAPGPQQGEIGSVLNREAWPTHLAQVLAPGSLEREGGSSLGHLCCLCLIRTDLCSGQDTHGATGKSIIIFCATSPPSHCPCLLQQEFPSAAM